MVPAPNKLRPLVIGSKKSARAFRAIIGDAPKHKVEYTISPEAVERLRTSGMKPPGKQFYISVRPRVRQ